MRAIIFDNEAVQALSDPNHGKHRAVVAHLAVVVTRRRKGMPVMPVVPTAVRVEAGWDRSDTRAAPLNRFRVVDHILDTALADTAAQIVGRTGVSVADAHIGAVVRHLPVADIVVLTSAPDDMARVSAPRPSPPSESDAFAERAFPASGRGWSGSPDGWHAENVSCALSLRLVARRHVDFQRVSSAMCRPTL